MYSLSHVIEAITASYVPTVRGKASLISLVKTVNLFFAKAPLQIKLRHPVLLFGCVILLGIACEPIIKFDR